LGTFALLARATDLPVSLPGNRGSDQTVQPVLMQRDRLAATQFALGDEALTNPVQAR
jgi:hypothetical protein